MKSKKTGIRGLLRMQDLRHTRLFFMRLVFGFVPIVIELINFTSFPLS